MEVQSIFTALAVSLYCIPEKERNGVMIRFAIEIVENYHVPLEQVKQTFVKLEIPMLENEYHWPIQEDLDKNGTV
jgi:hypothetical protein